MGRIAGKIAIITGAARGQGAEEAKLFAKEGAKVVATDLQLDALHEVVNEINANGGQAIALKHNVASKEDWQVVVQETVKAFGTVHILVNNAGITGPMGEKIENIDEATWDKIMDINLKGPFFGTQEVIPEMIKAGGGSIVNISSLSGIFGGGNAPYNSSKGGLRLLTKNVALDYGKHNIRVNSINPGTIDTPMIENVTGNDEVKNMVLAGIPLNKIGKPSDIAYGALYLASDESGFITGTELIIDGGSILV